MIPDFQTLMLPVMQILSDKSEHATQKLISSLADKYKMTKEEREELLPSGRQRIINNRVAWARIYLQKARLIESPKRSVYRITEDGLKILEGSPQRIDIRFLKTIPAFNDWQKTFAYQGKKDNNDTLNSIEEIDIAKTPEELIDYTFAKLKAELSTELLDKIISKSAEFFEQLVIDLLVKMGYGGYRKSAGRTTRLTGDGGIDGTIQEDKLGLDFIYLQAKKWKDKAVGRPDLQAFVGALEGNKASKGVFITTSRFVANAEDYLRTISKKVILIDGKQLTDLLIENNVGLSTKAVYEVKQVDNDYFDEE